jgi:hypothetical protein
VLTGFNTDIERDGVVYHVQTEDRGTGNPLIESLVYMKGEILATRRTDYQGLLDAGGDSGVVKSLMERQHRAIIDVIRAGRIDLLTAPPGSADESGAAAGGPSEDLLSISGEDLEAARRSQKTLDEVIGDWLQEQQRGERVKISVVDGGAFVFGRPFSLRIRVATAPGDRAIQDAQVSVRFLSTERKPAPLAEAESDAKGEATLAGEVPNQDKGTGLVIVSVRHPSGNDEVKFLVQR